jgi:hypothetical protein
MIASIPKRWLRVALIAWIFFLAVVGLFYSENIISFFRPYVLYAEGLSRYSPPTAAERACFDGTVERYNAVGLTQEIPKKVHFIWGPKGDGAFTFPFYLSIRSALHTLQLDKVELHYTYLDRENTWFKALEKNLTLVHHDPAEYLNGFQHASPDMDISHMADILRLQVLRAEGGIYLDSDAFVLRPFDTLLKGARDVVMAHEGGYRGALTNAVILAKKEAPFIRRWLAEYDTFDDAKWNYHSVILPDKLATLHPEDLCELSPTAFFWPTWAPDHIDWMHEPLTPEEADDVRKKIDMYGGGLFDDQLVYHAWSHGARKYLQRMTPETIKTEDTRFNLLIRRFVD